VVKVEPDWVRQIVKTPPAPVDGLTQFKTADELEDHLRETLEQVLKTKELVHYAARAPHIHAKWRIVSGIQKAVRRNKPNSAKVLTYGLNQIDKAYLKYRLAVIAVEDVGIGNLLPAAQLFYILRNKDFRDQIGEEKELMLYLHIIEQMAIGPKDRNSTEVSVLWKKWKDKDGSEWDHIGKFFGGDCYHEETLGKAMWAVTSLAKGEGGGKPELVAAYRECEVPEAVIYVAMHSLARMPYTLGAGLGLVWHLLEKSSYQGILDDADLLDDGQVGAYTAATFDKHTSEGKKAITHWRKQYPAMEQWLGEFLKADKSVSDALGMLLFDWEGSRCCHRLDYDGSEYLQRNAQIKIDSSALTHPIGEQFSKKWLHDEKVYAALYNARMLASKM
jgi:hypothetical protein